MGAFFVEYNCWQTCHTHPLTLWYLLFPYFDSIHRIISDALHFYHIPHIISSLPLPWTETYLDFNGPRILSYWTTTNVDSWLNFDFQINGNIHVYFTVFLVHVWLTSWKYWISHITSFILYFLIIYSLIYCILRLYIPNYYHILLMIHP